MVHLSVHSLQSPELPFATLGQGVALIPCPGARASWNPDKQRLWAPVSEDGPQVGRRTCLLPSQIRLGSDCSVIREAAKGPGPRGGQEPLRRFVNGSDLGRSQRWFPWAIAKTYTSSQVT